MLQASINLPLKQNSYRYHVLFGARYRYRTPGLPLLSTLCVTAKATQKALVMRVFYEKERVTCKKFKKSEFIDDTYHLRRR